ncbi:hypothetical protein F2P81_005832 [Scophthalmus maximus]|uniref:Uncharacterized protein n=1 Tax=Scophthalmus maximus TaxID=52904 RepID=A0A6A4TEV7_SCOMX|nr:hypothetical protein F2P81_005832 [Scophthalmus maximus]
MTTAAPIRGYGSAVLIFSVVERKACVPPVRLGFFIRRAADGNRMARMGSSLHVHAEMRMGGERGSGEERRRRRGHSETVQFVNDLVFAASDCCKVQSSDAARNATVKSCDQASIIGPDSPAKHT